MAWRWCKSRSCNHMADCDAHRVVTHQVTKLAALSPSVEAKKRSLRKTHKVLEALVASSMHQLSSTGTSCSSPNCGTHRHTQQAAHTLPQPCLLPASLCADDDRARHWMRFDVLGTCCRPFSSLFTSPQLRQNFLQWTANHDALIATLPALALKTTRRRPRAQRTTSVSSRTSSVGSTASAAAAATGRASLAQSMASTATRLQEQQLLQQRQPKLEHTPQAPPAPF